jgi:hypothetical protein
MTILRASTAGVLYLCVDVIWKAALGAEAQAINNTGKRRPLGSTSGGLSQRAGR